MHSTSSEPHNQSMPQDADTTLAESVRENLDRTGYQHLRRIDVAVEDGNVRLSGRVPKFYLLQLAQQAAMSTDGVTNLENGIEVVRG